MRLSSWLPKPSKFTLRTYLLIVILSDIVFLALSIYGTFGLYQWMSGMGAYYNFFLAEIVFLGMLATTNIIALPVVFTTDRHRAKTWRISLLPHIVANVGSVLLRLTHLIFLMAVTKFKEDHLYYLASFFPFFAWNIISGVLTYSYFRSVALYNVVTFDGGDGPEPFATPTVRIMGIRVPNIKLKLRWYVLLTLTLDAFFAAILIYSEVQLFFWIKEVNLSDYYMALIDVIFLAILLVSDILSLPVVIVLKPIRAKKFRMMLAPKLVIQVLIILFNIVHCIYSAKSAGASNWYHFIALFFPNVSWHVIAAAIAFAYYKKVTSYNMALEGFSTYGELEEENDEVVQGHCYEQGGPISSPSYDEVIREDMHGEAAVEVNEGRTQLDGRDGSMENITL